MGSPSGWPGKPGGSTPRPAGPPPTLGPMPSTIASNLSDIVLPSVLSPARGCVGIPRSVRRRFLSIRSSEYYIIRLGECLQSPGSNRVRALLTFLARPVGRGSWVRRSALGCPAYRNPFGKEEVRAKKETHEVFEDHPVGRLPALRLPGDLGRGAPCSAQLGVHGLRSASEARDGHTPALALRVSGIQLRRLFGSFHLFLNAATSVVGNTKE